MADWTTISSLATAGGTLVLAIATYASVRSANRAARTAERAFEARLRPVLVTSRLQDPEQKIGWLDGHWTRIGGGQAGVEAVDDVIYLSLNVRNVGAGLAVLHGWYPVVDWRTAAEGPHPDPDQFRRLSRDLYVAPSDVGFWQGAIRGRDDPLFGTFEGAIQARQRMAVYILYGDHEGGQRTISLFGLVPVETTDSWLGSSARHWNLDRPDPR